MPGIKSDTIHIKQTSENRVYEFDFNKLLATGETVTGVTSITDSPAELTIGSENVNNDADGCTARISGGTAGTTYTLTAIVTTSDSNTLVGKAELNVQDG